MIEPFMAIKAPSPPVDPPGDLDGSLGWHVVPKIGFEQSKEATPCGIFVRQNGIAPRWTIKSTSNNNKKGICVRVYLEWKFRSNIQIQDISNDSDIMRTVNLKNVTCFKKQLILKVSWFQRDILLPSIVPKNELENVNFCASILEQKFFVHF